MADEMNILCFLFPPRCVLCRKILKDDASYFCHVCQETAPFVKTQRLKSGAQFLSGNTSLFFYEGKARLAMKRLKYYNKPQYAQVFGTLLAKELVKPCEEPFDIITWVPAYRLKTWRRGYNQAELLAITIAKALNVPAHALLIRTRNTRPQSGLSPSQRKANMLGAFSSISDGRISGRRILLVDDILTTGATASECARMLFESGCREVYLATVAKTREK